MARGSCRYRMMGNSYSRDHPGVRRWLFLTSCYPSVLLVIRHIPAAASPISTQLTPAPLSQQEEEEGDPTAPTLTPPQRPPIDKFADPKIAELHLIFPDYDAAIL